MALEKNKIYCADCLDLMKEMEDNSVDLVLTDPPYNIHKAEWDIAQKRVKEAQGQARLF